MTSEFPTSHPSNIPIPDPSTLTVDMLLRESRSLREMVDIKFAGVQTSIGRIYQDATRDQSDIIKQIGGLRELHGEKFHGIDSRFIERDMRLKLAADAAHAAVTGAFQAQKEASIAQNVANGTAISKAEAATAKQLDSIMNLLGTSNSAMNDKIALINGRLDRGEGGNIGVREARVENHMTIGSVVGIVGGVVGVLSLIVMLAVGTVGRGGAAAGGGDSNGGSGNNGSVVIRSPANVQTK